MQSKKKMSEHDMVENSKHLGRSCVVVKQLLLLLSYRLWHQLTKKAGVSIMLMYAQAYTNNAENCTQTAPSIFLHVYVFLAFKTM